jgi:hypothetical protein
MVSSSEHTSKIVAVCVKRNITPNKTGFADFLFRLSAAYYQNDRRTTKKYIDTLIQAYHFDRWRTLVEQTCFLTQEEKNLWIREHL